MNHYLQVKEGDKKWISKFFRNINFLLYFLSKNEPTGDNDTSLIQNKYSYYKIIEF